MKRMILAAMLMCMGMTMATAENFRKGQLTVRKVARNAVRICL